MVKGGPVIVEGPDGGGKTTLAKQLAEQYVLEYTRPDPAILSSAQGPVGGSLPEWWVLQLAEGKRDRVYDRCFFISDPIYQQAQVERDLLMGSHILAGNIMNLWNLEPIIIFCLPDFEVQLSNVKQSERDRLEGVSDKGLEKINNAYWACFAMWSNSLFDRIMIYDYTREDIAWDDLTVKFESLRVEQRS